METLIAAIGLFIIVAAAWGFALGCHHLLGLDNAPDWVGTTVLAVAFIGFLALGVPL